eukprot:TRINITY_DN20318_c0_g1_i1.p1 TRINITY_DN20318_c0_g1~~TRINITY_DN20318_c0_g1_i1.p1  ORF type:complete len:481 (+),score=122.31 TRINITY_DN20318_c0_g1_i1:95-1537(+)
MCIRDRLSEYHFDASLFLVLPVFVAAAGVCLVSYCTVSSPNKENASKRCFDHDALRGHQPWGLAATAAACNCVFCIVQGALYDGSWNSHWVRVLLVFSGLLSLLQVVSVARVWRPTSRAALLEAQKRLLDSASTSEVKDWSAYNCGGVHTIDVPCSDPANAHREPIVLVHGFGGGAALWMNNLGALAAHQRVLALDWLGCGGSDRPHFPNFADPSSSEDFFVTGMEQWRAEMGLTRFVLVGHSLGAILVASYALKHPDRVSQLVLASPATPKQFTRIGTSPKEQCFKCVARLVWRCGVTPQAIMRLLGPLGPWLVQGMVKRRLSRWTEEQTEALSDPEALGAYLYQNWCRKASGEYALNGVLQPGNDAGDGWGSARLPLRERLRPETVAWPVWFIYGAPSLDWMDSTQGAQIAANLVAGGRTASVSRVPKAGHQLFVEQPIEFNKTLIQMVAAGEDLEQPEQHRAERGHQEDRGAVQLVV